MKVSLILPTYGVDKIHYFKNFLKGLTLQSYKDFELIVIDQNEQNEIEKVCAGYKDTLDIIYIKSKIKGLSYCRNIGLERATGTITAFPDDDCLYPKDLLENVIDFFSKNNFDLLSINCLEYYTRKKLTFISLKESQEFHYKDIFKAVSSISVFFRNLEEKNRFDEMLGLGAKFNSSEEFDFTFSFLLNEKKKAYYNSEFAVLHPDNEQIESSVLFEKVKKNSIGHGAFLKKYFRHMPLSCLEHLIIRPLAGILFYTITLKLTRAKISYLSLISRVRGFLIY